MLYISVIYLFIIYFFIKMLFAYSKFIDNNRKAALFYVLIFCDQNMFAFIWTKTPIYVYGYNSCHSGSFPSSFFILTFLVSC